ncbi:unnamed protein product, partial [Mesorhabditis spiculigera]
MPHHALRPKRINFEEHWQQLEPTVVKLINLVPVPKRSCFRDVYEICVAIPFSFSRQLYEAVQRCVTTEVERQYEKINKVADPLLLEAYHKAWIVFIDGIRYLNMLFRYLNNQFMKERKQGTGAESVYRRMAVQDQYLAIGNLGLVVWKKTLLLPIKDRLLNLLLQAISDDRNGNTTLNKTIISSVICSFDQVSRGDFGNGPSVFPNVLQDPPFYLTVFEEPFLELTRAHYDEVAQELCSRYSPSKYMEKIIQIMQDERVRINYYLNEESVEKVMSLCQEVLINKHKPWLESACHEMIDTENETDLRNMYILLKPISAGIQVMTKEFENHVKAKGLAALSKLNGDNVPAQFVSHVIQVYTKYGEMKKLFSSDGEFTSAFDKALQSIVNSREDPRLPSKAPERLARFTDNLLRKTGKGLSEYDIEKKLDEAIILFRYLEDKDMFQKFYSKMLANRLIMSTSIAMDSEELMINKLKQACGYEFTSKLSRMFTDIGLSKEMAAKFDAHVAEKFPGQEAWPFQPMVLGAAAWPLSLPQPIDEKDTSKEERKFTLPRTFTPMMNEFEQFYLGSHNGRKLSWLYNLSHADIRLNYLDKAYVVSMSAHQAAILFTLMERDSIPTSQCSSLTGLKDDLFDKNLLCIQESGIALIEQPGAVLSLNFTFTSKRIKFKLTSPHFTKPAEKVETDSFSATVAQDRKYYMECTIVRIMKTRKVMKHNALVQEVINQTRARFPPSIQFIKKSIEDLIEKLYIQRTEQSDEYQYLA